MTTIEHTQSSGSLKSLGGRLAWATLLMLALTAGVVVVDFLSGFSGSAYIPVMPFIFTLWCFAGKELFYLNPKLWLKVVIALTAIASLIAYVISLYAESINLPLLAIFPIIALISIVIRFAGTLDSMKLMGQFIDQSPVFLWIRRIAAILILAGGIAIALIAHWANAVG